MAQSVEVVVALSFTFCVLKALSNNVDLHMSSCMSNGAYSTKEVNGTLLVVIIAKEHSLPQIVVMYLPRVKYHALIHGLQ